MDMIKTTPNKIMAIFWIVLAFFVAFGSIPVLWSPAKLSIIGFLLLSIIFILMGLQRTKKYRFEDSRFKKILCILGITTAMVSAFIIILNATLF